MWVGERPPAGVRDRSRPTGKQEAQVVGTVAVEVVLVAEVSSTGYCSPLLPDDDDHTEMSSIR